MAQDVDSASKQRQPENTAAKADDKKLMEQAGQEAAESANLYRLIERLDGTGIAQYVRLMQSTRKVFWLNFLSGVARGLGFTVGTAMVIAVAYKIISGLIDMNIPVITELLQQLVEILQIQKNGAVK